MKYFRSNDYYHNTSQLKYTSVNEKYLALVLKSVGEEWVVAESEASLKRQNVYIEGFAQLGCIHN